MSDILIKNGILVDGTGGNPYKSNLLIKDKFIDKIGTAENITASKIIDANGSMVSPGFIDVHSHLDFFIPSPRHSNILETWARQGVTTIVSGNCGYSPAPINHNIEADLERYWYFAYPHDGLSFKWDTMEDFFKYVENQGISFNLAMLVGHNTLRANAMGFAARLPEVSEMEIMKKMLEESIKAGAFGLSLGLDYVPGAFSNTQELLELASVLTPYSAPLVPHTRGFLGKIFVEGMKEVIEVAEKNKIPLHLSHHAGGGISRLRKIALREIEEAISRGVVISHDNIPFPNSSTTVLNLFPPWAFAGGVIKFFSRLRDPETRETIKEEMKKFKPKWPPWENKWWTSRGFNEHIHLFGFEREENKKFNNLELIEIADLLKKKPIDTLIDLTLLEDGKIFYISGQFDNPLAEDYIDTLLSDPNCSIGTDIVGVDFNTISPAAFGAFTKVLGNMARDKEVFSLQEAVRKMTSLPASQMQIENRALLKEGYYADITIFNPHTIQCNASYKTPFMPSNGIEYVIINGKVLLHDGIYENAILPGKVLRKQHRILENDK